MSEMITAADFNERELEILQRIAQGQTNQEIASEMYISLNTVRWYNKQIYGKLGVHSRTSAISLARAYGLLAPAPDDTPLDDTASIPALPTLTNLPAPVTPFIGREPELRELSLMLADPDTRLVTIIGPGGMGKTRLAQRLARHHLPQFPHGVYLIALAPIRAVDNTPEAIINAIASTLHVTLYGDRSPEQQLLNYLSQKRMLLLLDNFEHLLDGAVVVSRILEAAPDVKTIATSRETLGLYGEVVYQLGGMALPERETQVDAGDYDAVQLFLQSAVRARADFTPTPAELQHIARICQLAEGMPLAIELSAAWVRSLSIDTILTELADGLDILENRVQNIRTVFDRSWQLLSDEERDTFARMSVFRGGCTREAAQSITSARTRMLISLVDKSLLWRLPDGHYAMHELLRQYASEKLQSMPDEDILHDHHRDYYAEFAGQWGRGLQNGQQVEGLEVLERNFENIRAAWNRAAQQRTTPAIAQLIDMWYFFDVRSRWQEGHELFDKAAASLGDPLLLARLMARQSNFTFRLGMIDRTRELALTSADLFRQAGVEAELSSAILSLGNIAFVQGDMAEAEHQWNEAAALAARHNERSTRAAALGNLSVIAENRGDFALAKDYLQQQLSIARDIGDFMSISMALINLGEIARQTGDLEAATTYYRGSLGTAQRIGQQYVIAGSLDELGIVARMQGRYDEARRLIEQSMSINREHGNRLFVIRNLVHLAEIAVEAGEKNDRARRCYHEALRLAAELRAVQMSLVLLRSVAGWYAHQGSLARAVEVLTLVQQHPGVRSPDQQQAAELSAELQTMLEPDDYEAAVYRGQEIDFETMLTALMIETEGV